MTIHQRIVRHVCDALAQDGNSVGKPIIGLSDEKIFHKIFQSYRGKGALPKGLRLTSYGHKLLSLYFKHYTIEMPEGYRLGTLDLLYLDNRAKMPYYIGRGEEEDGGNKLVVYEAQLGIMLKLADGMISNLRDMESF